MMSTQCSSSSSLAVMMSVYYMDTPARFREAIKSVFAQTIANSHKIRLYLAVDGPVGGELNDIISEFEPHDFRIFRLPSNCGLASALNVLILIWKTNYSSFGWMLTIFLLKIGSKSKYHF